MHFVGCLILFGLLSVSHAFGQSNFYYPNHFTAYYQNMSQITPAYVSQEGRAEFTAGYKSLTGAFRKISSYYFTAEKIFRKENDQAHAVRLQFYNEKEGSFISSPRVYANYAYLLPISENTSAYAGLAIGIAGVYYSSPTTTQNSFTLPDGSIGIGIRSNWIEMGASMMQALNSAYSPVTSVVTYKRFYNSYAKVQKQWASEWGVKSQLLWRHLPSLSNEMYGAASFFYSHYFEFGASLKYEGGLAIFTLFGIDSGEDRLQVLLNYNSPFLGIVPSWQSNLEVGLSYKL